MQIISTTSAASICRSHQSGQPSGGAAVVLIDLGVYAVSSEPIGKAQHTLLVLDRVVAVADEAPRRALFRQRRYP